MVRSAKDVAKDVASYDLAYQRGYNNAKKYALANPGACLGYEQLASLRALRLWHWQQALWNRKLEQSEVHRSSGMSDSFRTNANFHLKAVQTLNDFFPAGDTAERDAAQ